MSKRKVQIEDIGQRTSLDGKRRLSINDKERQLLRERAAVARASALFLGGLTMAEVAGEVEMPVEQLAFAALNDEYPEFQVAVIDRVIGLFLDLEAGHTRAEIMDSVGMTRYQFEKLTQLKAFEERYGAYFVNLRSDPVLQVVQQAIVQELLPKAMRTLEAIMTSETAPANARMRAAIEVLNRSGVRNVEPEVSDRHDLAKFLGERNITVNQYNNYNVPPEYMEAVKKYDVLEGEIVEEESSDTGS